VGAELSRRKQTRNRLLTQALDLFEKNGYEKTSAAEIAAAAGVSEMTFFRYFPTKDRVVLDDPYDARLVSAVAARPVTESPLARTVHGLRSAWSQVPGPAIAIVRRRTRIVASTPTLRAAVWRNNQRTEEAVSEQLIADGCERLEARAAVSAVLAALTSALLWWAAEDGADLSTAVERALSVFDGGQQMSTRR
jgi:AcrR family transcriptional regulator